MIVTGQGTLVELYDSGDVQIKEIVRRFYRYLAIRITNLILNTE